MLVVFLFSNLCHKSRFVIAIWRKPNTGIWPVEGKSSRGIWNEVIKGTDAMSCYFYLTTIYPWAVKSLEPRRFFIGDYRRKLHFIGLWF